MALNLMTLGSSHVTFKNMFCMYVWDLGKKSDFQKNVKICGYNLMFFFSSFPYSDSHFVTYKAFIKPLVPLRVDFIQGL